MDLLPSNLFKIITLLVFLFHYPTEFVVVHNGIITNYKDIKKFLVGRKKLL